MLSDKQKIYPPLKFSSTKYPFDIEDKLRYIEILDIDDPEDRRILKEHAEELRGIPEAEVEMARLYEFEGQHLKHIRTLEQILEEHPSNIHAKGELYLAKYGELEEEERSEAFRRMFHHELKCLFNNEPLDYLISDSEFYRLFILTAYHYSEQGKTEHLKRLYTIAKTLKIGELEVKMAYIIKDKEMPLGYNLNLVPKINKWAEQVFENLENYDFTPSPHYEVFYSLLNKRAEDITDAEIKEITEIEDTEKLQKDVVWLLAQGQMRIVTYNGECNIDFYLNALYIVADKDLTQLTPFLLDILQGMPEEIQDEVFGDAGYALIGAPLQKLGSQELEGFLDLMKYDYEGNWYLRSQIVNVLGAISEIGAPNNEEVNRLLHELWDYYSEHDHIMLGWTFDAIQTFEVEGFDEKIKQAFEKDYIAAFEHGTYKDYLKGKKYKSFKAFEKYENLHDYYEQPRKVASQFSSDLSMSIDEHIKFTIKYFEKLAGEMQDYLEMQLGEDDFSDVKEQGPLDD